MKQLLISAYLRDPSHAITKRHCTVLTNSKSLSVIWLKDDFLDSEDNIFVTPQLEPSLSQRHIFTARPKPQPPTTERKLFYKPKKLYQDIVSYARIRQPAAYIKGIALQRALEAELGHSSAMIHHPA